MTDEWLDIVDEQDHIVGRAPRGEATAQRLLHRVAFIRVLDEHGRLFVHRRAPTKLVFPSYYDMFVGGVVAAGESYDEAARREATEELGVDDLPELTFLDKFLYESPQHAWWSAVYELRYDGPVHPQADEIVWHAFLTEDELAAKLSEWPFVPDGLAAYRRLRGEISDEPVDER
jgi:isopentenyldiphosphate isomerase